MAGCKATPNMTAADHGAVPVPSPDGGDERSTHQSCVTRNRSPHTAQQAPLLCFPDLCLLRRVAGNGLTLEEEERRRKKNRPRNRTPPPQDEAIDICWATTDAPCRCSVGFAEVLHFFSCPWVKMFVDQPVGRSTWLWQAGIASFCKLNSEAD
ncbi:hypothetical protein CSOJ01_01562 [Colletotrichum sojae]|uniref:Uncharacterized protein n=1 Tax=Colletotrichum sojae TaxID=2175907 RepID=A0A8H6JTI8_9PEZI|nr:hypothetical protein CSOJ01_01562 [Colletotrichum sojae]